jgi:aldehyde:ferredoxin oxidoreductase
MATLTPARLRDMIDSYYAARGLDSRGQPDEASLADLQLGRAG